jgi:cellulose synthase/poly-beta-1,6-N-acetylglucosamine synthase-like glycosyltransferase
MDRIFLALFCATLLLCVATYVLYPIGIWIAAKVFPYRRTKADIRPTVSVIISAYNEEKDIEAKIRNTRSLDYPRDRVEILVGSDGSIDRTAEIAGRFAGEGVRTLSFPFNRGKTMVQNDCVAASTAGILVFTDAASFLNPGALNAIIRNFADARVGCVAGSLRYVNTDANLTTESQGVYWKYESAIRAMESDLGAMIGVDGPLYAIRRENFVPLEGHVISDLVSPLLVRAAGKGVVLEPEAVADEEPTTTPSQEIRTRRRITVRALVGLFAYPGLLNPIRHPWLSIQIAFHKLLRWFVGPLAAMNFLSACAMAGRTPFFRFVAYAYAVLLAAACAGYLLERLGVKLRLFSTPYYFVLVNWAATLGILDFLRNRQSVSWQPVRSLPAGRKAP